MNSWSTPKKIPLQRRISKPLERLMKTTQCLNEIQEEVNEIEKTIEKLQV